MNAVFLLGLMLLAVGGEVLAGNWHWFWPLTGNMVLYFQVSNSWRQSCLAALLGGMGIDALMARPGWYTAAALLLTVPLAWVWDKEKFNSPLALNCIYGALLPWYMFGIMSLCKWAISGTVLVWSREALAALLVAGVLNALLLPLTIILADALADWLDLPEFTGREGRRKQALDAGGAQE